MSMAPLKKSGLPGSNALRNNVQIRVKAHLES